MLNQVQLIGFLGADPEVRSLNDGARVANLRIATTETWRDRDSGEKRERTEWHRITVWGENTVKFLSDYARKGSLLFIDGKLQTRSWEKDGETRYATEVVVQQRGGQVKILRDGQTSQPDDEPAPPQQEARASRGRSRKQTQAPPETFSADLDDEIPF